MNEVANTRLVPFQRIVEILPNDTNLGLSSSIYQGAAVLQSLCFISNPLLFMSPRLDMDNKTYGADTGAEIGDGDENKAEWGDNNGIGIYETTGLTEMTIELKQAKHTTRQIELKNRTDREWQRLTETDRD